MGHAHTYVFVWLCLSAIVGTLPRLKQMSFLAAAAEPNTRVSSLVFLSFLVYFAYYNRDLLSAFVVASSQCGHKTWQQSQLLSHKPSERGQTVWTTPVKLIESGGRRQAAGRQQHYINCSTQEVKLFSEQMPLIANSHKDASAALSLSLSMSLVHALSRWLSGRATVKFRSRFERKCESQMWVKVNKAISN